MKICAIHGSITVKLSLLTYWKYPSEKKVYMGIYMDLGILTIWNRIFLVPFLIPGKT